MAVMVLVLVIVLTLTACQERDAQAPESADNVEITDMRGRTVRVSAPVESISIDDSRYLVALGLIHPDSVSLLAAWPHDVNRLGAETYSQLLAKSPALATLPKVASSAGDFDVESILAAEPDVAILSLESGVTDAQIARVEQAGIPVVVLDFFTSPFQNLERSLLILGKLTGRQQQAADFVAFRAERMKRIEERVQTLAEADRPKVFLEAHAGRNADCCNSPGRGNVGDYIAFVGGHNIGADVISQSSGKLNLEYVISRNPDVYIATGGPHLEDTNGMVLGADYTRQQALEALRRVTSRRGIESLRAVRTGRAHGFSHQLLNSPLDIVAIEAFAKWIHPELFADVDPAATLAQINDRFLVVPFNGTYWITLDDTDSTGPGAEPG